MLMRRIFKLIQSYWPETVAASPALAHGHARSVVVEGANSYNTSPQESAEDSPVEDPPVEDPLAIRYYANLELPLHASEAEVRAAYKRLLRQYHPDQIDPKDVERHRAATEVTRVLNEAADYLLSTRYSQVEKETGHHD